MAVVINGTTGITNDGGYTGDGIVFADTTPANTLVTTTGGNVGIGTSSPTVYGTYKTLEVRGTGGGLLQLGTGTSTAAYLFQDGTNAGFTNIANGIISFATNNTERARIESSGNLLVGQTTNGASGKVAITTANGASGSAIATTNVSGTAQYYAAAFYNNGSTNSFCGGVSVSGTTTTYATSSDYRLKENIQPMTGALSVVAQLKPCTYSWKTTGDSTQGFIAHELQEVVPECVVGEKDAVDENGNPQYQGIDTSFLVATLTAAIQEQQAQIVSLQDTVTSQAEALASLTTRLAALEAK